MFLTRLASLCFGFRSVCCFPSAVSYLRQVTARAQDVHRSAASQDDRSHLFLPVLQSVAHVCNLPSSRSRGHARVTHSRAASHRFASLRITCHIVRVVGMPLCRTVVSEIRNHLPTYMYASRRTALCHAMSDKRRICNRSLSLSRQLIV